MGYKIVDSVGDAGLEIRADGIDELIRSASAGFLELVTDPRRVRCRERREVHVDQASLDDPGDLLVRWLNELVFLADTDGFLVKDVAEIQFDQQKLTATAVGEFFDAKQHERRLLIKAATYHDLRVEQIGNGYSVSVLLDI